MRVLTTAAAVAVFGLGGAAYGASFAELEFNLNGLSSQTADSSSFDISYTGDVLVTSNDPSNLLNVLGDGVSLVDNGTFTDTLSSFNATVSMVNGAISGGNFTLALASGESYTATIADGTGAVSQTRTGFRFSGLTFDGAFTSSNFGGVDVSNFLANIPLAGNFIEFAYNPDANGFDADSSMDIFVVVPTPLGAGLGVAGLAVVAVRRRRTLA